MSPEQATSLKATSGSKLFPVKAVYTIQPEQVSFHGHSPDPMDQTFDLAIVEFNDDGGLVDPEQKTAMLACIEAARRRPNIKGAVVVVFIHGWQNSARWNRLDEPNDQNFAGFRKVLATLCVRESERVRGSERRVVGVFLAWDGVPAWWPRIWGKQRLTFASFWNRNRRAKIIGGGTPMLETIADIVRATKRSLNDAPNNEESPLVLAGHSMGAMMLETAFLALLDEKNSHLLKVGDPTPSSAVQVKHDGQSVFPDVLIGLNSAGDSRITKNINQKLKGMTKSVGADALAFAAPLFVSLTSKADWVTGFIWRFSTLPTRKTVGHDKELITHTFEVSEEGVLCKKKENVPDFGQEWSCLRPPVPPDAASPSFPIDLPERGRWESGEATHTRYELEPKDHKQQNLVWVFRVPAHVSNGHSDIFNARCSLLLLALIQISGAVMSLAPQWKDNFEPIQADGTAGSGSAIKPARSLFPCFAFARRLLRWATRWTGARTVHRRLRRL